MIIRFTNKLFIIILFIFLLASCTKDKKPIAGINNKVILTSITISQITSDSALSGGNISSDGGDPILERGVCWGIAPSPTIGNSNFTSNGSGSGVFVSKIKNLIPVTVYYLRAYIKNAQGEIYGNELTFKTLAKRPILNTLPVTSIDHISAKSGGAIVSDGGSQITKCGLVWSLVNKIPTLSDSIILAPLNPNTFSLTLTELLGNTTYYVRSFATNSIGTGYGDSTFSFKTEPPKIPILTNASIASITKNSAQATATMSSNEGAAVSQYGFCWSILPNPTLANSFISSFGNISGSFNRNLTGLSANTTYNVRAFAINSVGTSYSSISSQFTTLPNLVPTVNTLTVGSITYSNATFSGAITDDGGATVTERGFYYSTSNTPTPSNSIKVVSGSGIGAYSSIVTSLSSNTTYFVRAYGLNSVGLALSNSILSFKTNQVQIPNVITTSPTQITSSSFSSGGNVTFDGGTPVTERGVCWSTFSSPNISNTKSANGNGLGSFIVNGTSLIPNTIYYLRAYAINIAGVGYGTETTILTSLQTPSLSSPANATTIGCCNNSFSWNVVPGATSYEIEWSMNNSFIGSFISVGVCGSASALNKLYVNAGNTTSSTICINTGTSSNNGLWYWRVRAKSGNNVSDWSVTRTYTYRW